MFWRNSIENKISLISIIKPNPFVFLSRYYFGNLKNFQESRERDLIERIETNGRGMKYS